MARFNYARLVKRADALIQRYGPVVDGKLRRGTTDRACRAVVIEYRSTEKGLRNEGVRRALLSTIDPTNGQTIIPPDFNLDKLVVNGEVLRIMKPDEGPRPGGITVYHDLETIYDSSEV